MLTTEPGATPSPERWEPGDFVATADWTEETVEANPEWTIDLCDEVVGGWRGERNAVAAMNAGQPATIGARLAVTRGGKTFDLEPLYKLNPKSGHTSLSSSMPTTLSPGTGTGIRRPERD